MLKQLSRLERTRNIVILGFVALMAISLVLFFRPNAGSNTIEPSKSSEALAKVNGDTITIGDFVTSKLNLQNQFSRFGGQISLERMGFSDDRILDGLIVKKITYQEAERLGLGASQAEIAQKIRGMFSEVAGQVRVTRRAGRARVR